MARGHNDAYKAKREALKRRGKREQLPCWICRMPIDYDLDWRDAMAYTYDHVKPVNAGGSMRGEGRPAHRSCNSRRGDESNRVEVKRATNRSRDWYAGPVDRAVEN